VLALVVALRRRRLAHTVSMTARLVAGGTTAAAIESPAADNRFAYAPAIAIGVVMAALSW
jgi:hypothetical protein